MRMLALFLLACAACEGSSAAIEPVRDEAASATTRWVTAQGVSNLSLLEASARVLAAPNASAVVTAPAGARVLRVRVRAGQNVEQGEPLVDVLVPDVVHAAGSLSSAMLRLHAAEARRGRLAPLVEQGLSRASELADLDATIAITRAEAQTARATLRAAGLSDQRASTLLESDGSIALRSPLAGMVTAVDAQPGEVRDPAAGPLVQIAGSSEVQIEARLTNSLPEGARFEWVSAQERLPLVLRAEAPRANAQDGSRLAWFDVPTDQKAPTAGTVGRVRTLPERDWVMVPSRAVELAEGKASVTVLSGERTERVPVRVLMQSGSESVVVGIAIGTRVAADAALLQRATP